MLNSTYEMPAAMLPAGCCPARCVCGALSARALALAVVCCMLLPGRATAQQLVTDDAAIVDARACQLELWHGESASWILPACQLLPRLELAAGIGFILNGARERQLAAEAKYLFREYGEGTVGVGMVAGAVAGPRDGGRRRLDAIYVYAPVSLSLARERLILHANAGWHFERDDHGHDQGPDHDHGHGHGRHAAMWAARADLHLPGPLRRITLLGELFGENDVRPEFQVGLRTVLLADRLSADVTWGGHTAASHDGAGWTAGIAWTPPSWF